MLPSWVKWWLILDFPIILWDAMFLIMRPHSLPGGKYSFIWCWGEGQTSGYGAYIRADKIYGDMSDPWSVAQMYGNLIEMVLQLYTVWLLIKRKPSSTFWVFTVSLMTFFKTLLYLFYELIQMEKVWSIYTDPTNWLMSYVLPTSVWFLLPFLCMILSGHEMISALNITHQQKKIKQMK